MPTMTAGNAPIIAPSGQMSTLLPGEPSSGMTHGPIRNSVGGEATIVESQVHDRVSAMLSSRPSAVVWMKSAHGLNALTERYG